MRKIQLDVGELTVESFETSAEGPVRGTVVAHATQLTVCKGICGGSVPFDETCGNTCDSCGDHCTWMPEFTCYTYAIAFPTECGTCQTECWDC